MSSGRRYKFQGSTISVMTSLLGGSPKLDITAITKANPAVVTTGTAHGITTAGAVYLTEILGMTELNNDLQIAVVLTTTTFSLWGVNSTGYGTYTSGGKVDPSVMSIPCELTNWNRQGGSKNEIPAETICSDAKEYELGLADFGTSTMSLNYAPLTTTQAALAAYEISGDKIAVHTTLPNSGGDGWQLGFVQQRSEQAAVNGLWTAQVVLRNTGRPYNY